MLLPSPLSNGGSALLALSASSSCLRACGNTALALSTDLHAWAPMCSSAAPSEAPAAQAQPCLLCHAAPCACGRQHPSACSTSTSTSSASPFARWQRTTPSSSFFPFSSPHGARRGYKKHFVDRPNLAQPIDTNTLDELLTRAASPAAAALPTLKYASLLNPRQTTGMLQKLPRLDVLHRSRYGCGWDEQQRRTYGAVMACLQRRLCDVMQHCSAEELERGLWGLGTAGLHSAKVLKQLQPGSPLVAAQLSAWLAAAPQPPPPRLLSHAAWYLAAAGQGEHVAMTQVADLLALTSSGSAAEAAAALGPKPPAAAVDGAAASAALTPLPAPSAAAADLASDHRSMCRLAWAFSMAGVMHEGAWRVVAGAATRALEGLLKKHRPSKGGLRPTCTYTYRTTRGPLVLPAPRPYRPSKYLRFSGARVTSRSFDLRSAASLLTSLARIGLRDRPCLSALERAIAAMLPVPGAGGGPLGAVKRPPTARLPGSPGAMALGVGGTVLPVLPAAGAVLGSALPAPLPGGMFGMGAVVEAAAPAPSDVLRRKLDAAPEGTALSQNLAGQLLHGFYALRYRSPAVAAAVLSHVRYSSFHRLEAVTGSDGSGQSKSLQTSEGAQESARRDEQTGEQEQRPVERVGGERKLATIAHMAVALGLQGGQGAALMARLVAQGAAPLMGGPGQEVEKADAAALVAACARVGLRPGTAAQAALVGAEAEAGSAMGGMVEGTAGAGTVAGGVLQRLVLLSG